MQVFVEDACVRGPFQRLNWLADRRS